MFRGALSTHFARHYGVIDRQQAIALGVTRSELAGLLRSGRWIRVHSGVYRLADAPDNPMLRLAAACLAGGTASAASHLSALWLWDVVVRPPDVPVISVTRRHNPRLARVIVYRRTDLIPDLVSERRGLPVTNPLPLALRRRCDDLPCTPRRRHRPRPRHPPGHRGGASRRGGPPGTTGSGRHR